MDRMGGLYLAPVPKRLTMREGTFSAAGKEFIRLEGEDVQALALAAKKSGLPWQITASPKAPKDMVGLFIHTDYDADIREEGYKLTIRPERIEITAADPAGAYYGACTLAQIIRQVQLRTPNSELATMELPCLSITDWPDFAHRGVMLDISRDKVPTMETLYHLVDLLSEWKINQLQLYTEHAFQYLAHPVVWEHADPMTGEQIVALDAYCMNRFIDLVPNQNSFGHMERWLKHKEYNSMAEAPNGCETIWGFRPAFSLCPIDKRCLPFVRGLYEELLPHFTSGFFNVGCDETVDLGCGRSRKVCEEVGQGRVYLDFLLDIHGLVEEFQKTMMYWGDIIIKHPDLIPELPKDALAIEWGYESNHPFAENCARFAEAGVPFYVGPGTSSWNTLAGRTENAIDNITNAAQNGLKQGALGLLNTDWGDNGHWQPLSVSYLGFIAGAMASWNAKADLHDGLAEALSIHAFGDVTGSAGRAFYDLGNVYRSFGKRTHNHSVPWLMLFREFEDASAIEGLKREEFEEMERRLNDISDTLSGERMTSPDADIVRRELRHLMSMMRLSAETGKARLDGRKPADLTSKVGKLKDSHKSVWLLLNREGGLVDSLGKLIATDGG